LPERSGRSIPADLSRYGRTLVEQYRLDDGVFQLRIRASSALVGTAADAVDLAAHPGLALVAVQAAEDGGRVRGRALREGDVLILRGEAEAVAGYAEALHLGLRDAEGGKDGGDSLFNRRSGLAEVVIPPRSQLIGQTMHPGMVTPSGDLVVLAIQRAGEMQGPGPTVLMAGDTLLLQGTWAALDEHLGDPEVLVVNPPETVRQQAVPMGQGAPQALAVLGGMVLLLATGLLPSVVVGLVAACAMVVLGVVRVEQAYRGINWTTVILIGGMTPLSTAMSQTGAAQMLADGLVALVGDAGPYALLAGLFVLTAVLGQLISNTATALIIIPISLAAAIDLGISPAPVLMAVTVAAAAAFLTPVATPVNLMVMGPAGYRFGDYWKLGLPMMIWFFVVATFLVPVFWPFK
jgi:di/tricarboxylate transporter